MRSLVPMMILASTTAWGIAPTADQSTVNVRWPDASREVLHIEGQTYRAELGVAEPGLRLYGEQETPLLVLPAGAFMLGDVPVTGPGRINIYSFGTQMYQIHLRDLEAEGFENGEIEMALYCYGDRIFIQGNARRYDDVDPPQPRFGEWRIDETQAGEPRSETRLNADLRAMVFEPQTTEDLAPPQTRRTALAAVVGRSEDDLTRLVTQETRADQVTFELDGGVLDGYMPDKGFYQITTVFRGPFSFEDAWINPNMRVEVDMTVESPFDADIICNVRNTYGTLEASVVTDEHGFPLPVQVQVSKNFGGEFEEGREEGDASYGEAYVPISVGPDEPFVGQVYHLWGNWGTRPLKQISSIRFFHHYFHASLGPTETFCYTPFEYPRDDGGNYILADVRGLSNFAWPGQPQHDHVSVVGGLRYKSGGEWINQLHQRTEIFLTSPVMASFALDYLSEDGKVDTRLEIFELPQTDEARAFVKMRMNVREPVELDGPSAHNLRFLNAGAYIVRTVWPQVAYTNADGETAVVDVPADNTWTLEGEPLGPEYPFCAAYPHSHGNMAFFIRQFEGRLGGEDVPQFGLSVFGDERWTEMFLTAPGSIDRLEAGDWIEAQFFVMPYGHAQVDHAPAERQRMTYGDKIAQVTDVRHGELYPGWPPRLRIGDDGYARFTLEHGENWHVFLVEGFDAHKAPMLWEHRGAWLFHDQQIHGNDWYQAYRAEDGSIGYVFAVQLRPDMTHDYLVTQVPTAAAITLRNGFVTIANAPGETALDFVSPLPFDGVENTPIGDTGLYRVTGDAAQVTSLE